MKKLPGRTVERLSEYRRSLLGYLEEGNNYIYSHELAALLHITAVQVRRDLMLIGYSSILKKGYDVKELIKHIGDIIDSEEGQNVAVIGVGNLGRAIIRYFKGKRSKLNIVAAFDSDPQKVERTYSGVKCYPMEELGKGVSESNISIAILTVPPEFAKAVAEEVIKHGIKGILNFTTVSLNMPPNVHLEEYDMITSLEKVAYFVKED
ncbi:MAG TPA: redox-sensing transcriptional repressor Rex [Bacteroidales bacterium]|nr:redox-sensing transcriptional repressor Rex [Bacteroidales bacterium]